MRVRAANRCHLRRRERGAALTEAAVAIPVFLVLFGGLVFAHRLYALKETSRAEARHAMWAWALNACEDGKYTVAGAKSVAGDDPNALDAVKDETNALPPSGEDLIDKANDDPNTDLEVGSEWGVARGVASRGPLVAPPPFGNLSKEKVTTAMEVQCDEKPRGASPADVLAFVWKLPETLALSK